MTNYYNQFVEAWNNPAMRHSMFVHLPVVLVLVGLAMAIASALARRNTTLRWTAITTFVVLALAAYFTVESGENADDAIPKVLTPEVYTLIEDHESMAERVWMFAIATAILVATGSFKWGIISRVGPWLAVVVSIAAAGWIARTAHLGGTLVYHYGVGTPNPVVCETMSLPTAPESTDQVSRHFDDHVKPVIVGTCMRCHNPTRARRSGGLDQTTREGLLTGGRSGPAIVPGDPDASLIIQRLRHSDLDEVMPPPPRDPLPEETIAAFEKWIRDGAAWTDVQWAAPQSTESQP